MNTTRVSTLSGLLLAASAVAQGPLFPHDTLIGWSQGSPGFITAQRPAPDCSSRLQCNNVLGPVTTTAAGGTAYDPRYQAAWVSDGQVIEFRDLRGCGVRCTLVAQKVLAGTVVSGLTMEDGAQRLWQLETQPGFYAITTYDVSGAAGACAVQTGACSVPLNYPGTPVATGIAFDQPRKLIYVVVQTQVGGIFVHYLHVSHASNPCNVICRAPIRHLCADPALGITGLAYDAKGQILHLTERRNLFRFAVVDPLNCNFSPMSGCCVAAAPYRGLAYVSGWRLDVLGTSCYPSTCNACPSLRAVTTGGDPSIGNSHFALRLAGADPGQQAACLVKLGPCAPGGVPFLCGRLYPFPVTAVFTHVTAGGPCQSGATQPLPIPAVGALMGVTLCNQWGVLCSVDPINFALTNGIEFAITGS